MPKESRSFFRGKEVSAGGVGVGAGRETFPGKGQSSDGPTEGQKGDLSCDLYFLLISSLDNCNTVLTDLSLC